MGVLTVIVAATGHRLGPKLGGYDLKTRRALGALAVDHLASLQPDSVISGMAIGWDQAVAAAAIRLNIPLVAAVPFDGQESMWPQEVRDRYIRLLKSASRVVIVSDRGAPNFNVVRAMQHRNEWMVDRADEMAALWDGSFGGTFNCIRSWERRQPGDQQTACIGELTAESAPK